MSEQQSKPKKIVKSIAEAVNEEVSYLSNMKQGIIKPTITPFNFINESSLNGLHPSDIITIAGMSGGGKTAFANKLGRGICATNDCTRMLYFSFELAARKMVSRLVSKQTKMTMKDIYNINKDLSLKEYQDLKDLPIDYVERPLKSAQIKSVIAAYCKKYHNDRIFVVIDHSLLVVPDVGGNESTMLKELCSVCNEIKKDYNIIICILSQLNNAMLEPTRMTNPAQQYPRLTDLFGSKYLVHISDNITVLVDPSSLNLINGKKYGVHGLPTSWNLQHKTGEILVPLIYAHTIKARDGRKNITPLVNLLKHQQLAEFPKKELERFWNVIKGANSKKKNA